MAEFSGKKKSRNDSYDSAESRFDYSPEVKRLKEDLLFESFDDGEIFTESSELDSFMKSFEEEILSAKPAPATAAAATATDPALVVVDLTSESDDSQPDNLGYLLGASDDDLGIPPSRYVDGEIQTTELVGAESDSSEFGGDFWACTYSEDLPNFDAFEARIVEFGESVYNGGGGDYAALNGLFDYSDMGFGSNDILWRPETLHAK